MTGRIKVESGTRHVLAWCADCPSWRTLRADRAAALRAGAEHLHLVHGEAKQAGNMRLRAERIDTRHADG